MIPLLQWVSFSFIETYPANRITSFHTLSAGASHSLTIDGNNQIFTWGLNFYGQLGDETTIDRSTPTLLE
jgi:alpha-tubulin suppressor-like RCC1 family protein